MSHWCSKCQREPYVGCDHTCPAFGYDESEAAERIARGPKPMVAQLFARSTGVPDEYIVCGLVKCRGLSDESVHVLKTSAIDVLETTNIEELAYGKGLDNLMKEVIWRHFK